MQPAEALLVVATMVALMELVAPMRGERRPSGIGRTLALLAALGFAGVVLTGGGRWQQLPLVAAIGLALLIARRPHESTPQRVVGVVAGLLALTSAGLMWALPVLTLPEPSGPFAVGTTTRLLVDRDREEIYSETDGDARRIMVQIWYPAEATDGQPPQRWLNDPEALIPALAAPIGVPAVLLGHLRQIGANAIPEAPVAGDEERYPVIVYSHGWTGFRRVAANQMETLASHGYIVAAADHTYGALMTVFPEGERVGLNPEALPDDVPDDVYDAAAERLEATFAADVGLILDQLPRLTGPLAGRLDMERVGLLGHSTGGGAVVRQCRDDPRCDAVLGFDAWVEPVPDRVIEAGLDRPALFIRSDGWVGTPNDRRLRRLFDRSSTPRYLLELRGTIHRDFTLQPLLSPLGARLELSGELGAERTIELIDRYMLAFFDRYLRNRPAPALDGDGPTDPEIGWEVVR